MAIVKATREDFGIVHNIVFETINEVYPKYYPSEVVAFFLNHHSVENILADLDAGNLYLVSENGDYVATGTINEDNINRVFVLPKFQGKGFGSQIMTFLEEQVGINYDNIYLSSSLPAFKTYTKRGYSSIEYNEEIVDNNEVLCYHFMKKMIIKKNHLYTNLNGKIFKSINNTDNGEVSESTLFEYHQQDDIIWANYKGGEITKGYLIGKFVSKNVLNFSYQHINVNKQIRMGNCESYLEILDSFFINSLYVIMQAANAIENFRYRIEGEQVICYDMIHPAYTIGREDGTFGFSFSEYATDRNSFALNTKMEIERVKSGQGLMLSDSSSREDVIHYSSVPWIRFTDMKHTASFSLKDSIPKISTGKCVEIGGRFMMPVSITVHHALMDGFHVAQFLDKLQEFIEQK